MTFFDKCGRIFHNFRGYQYDIAYHPVEQSHSNDN